MPVFLLIKSEVDVHAVNYELIESISLYCFTVEVVTHNKVRYSTDFFERLRVESVRGGANLEMWQWSIAYRDFMDELARSRASNFFKEATSVPKPEGESVSVVDLYGKVEGVYDYAERCEHYNDPMKGGDFVPRDS